MKDKRWFRYWVVNDLIGHTSLEMSIKNLQSNSNLNRAKPVRIVSRETSFNRLWHKGTDNLIKADMRFVINIIEDIALQHFTHSNHLKCI
jgi:hypothetical protein